MILKNNLVTMIGLSGGLLLLPGVNLLSDEKWEELKKDSLIKSMIDEETLVVIAQNEKPIKDKDGKTIPSSSGQKSDLELILAMPEAKAIKMAKETGNRELLKQWKEKETREKVLKAIEKQLADIADIKYRGEGN